MQTQTAKRTRGRLSADPWEIEYLHHQLPTFSEDEITRVLDQCKQELQGSKDRKAIVDCVRRKLA